MCDLQAATRASLVVEMRAKRQRVDEMVTLKANAIAQVRELSASLRAISTSDRAPRLQLLFFRSAALHRGAPVLVDLSTI
jgi:hypothetical protein